MWQCYRQGPDELTCNLFHVEENNFRCVTTVESLFMKCLFKLNNFNESVFIHLRFRLPQMQL
jgi:hypothetical protein